MSVHKLITPSSTYCNLEGSSKKRILETISKMISENNPDMDSTSVFNGLRGREKLGSTGIGDGIAIPHCRLAECHAATGFLVKLKAPIDFDSIDRQPVDLIFALVVPEDATSEHLQTLAAIAEMFSSPEIREQLRTTKNSDQLYNTFCKLST